MSISSPNMGMPLPVPGVDTGPTYATLISGYSNVSTTSCLQILDSHDHSSGKGIPIGPSGLNINADLPLNGNNLNTIRAARFNVQTPATPAVSPDIGCVYFSGVDLYVNDFSGNQIRMTQSGGVAGSPGSITGLVSPATVTYSGGNYVFQSAANTAANLDAESVILRNAAVNSKGLTLNPPNSMANNYSITMPAVTSSATSFLAMDSSGNITEATPYPLTGAGVANQTITQGLLASRSIGSSVAAGGVALSSNEGGSSSATSPFTICSVSITTTGRPVFVGLAPAFSANPSIIGAQNLGTGVCGANFFLLNSSLVIAEVSLVNFGATNSQIQMPPGALYTIDVPPAGTQTYIFKAAAQLISGSNVVLYTNVRIIAYEL